MSTYLIYIHCKHIKSIFSVRIGSNYHFKNIFISSPQSQRYSLHIFMQHSINKNSSVLYGHKLELNLTKVNLKVWGNNGPNRNYTQLGLKCFCTVSINNLFILNKEEKKIAAHQKDFSAGTQNVKEKPAGKFSFRKLLRTLNSKRHGVSSH